MTRTVIWLMAVFCLVFSSVSMAAPEVALDTLELELTTEKPIVDESVIEDWQTQGRLQLGLQGEFSDSAAGKLVLELYDTQGYNILTTDEFDAGLETVVDEANVTIMEPFSLPLDLKIGRQYINLGRGDGVTTFNLFYPQDMRSVTEMGEYRSVDAVRADWYTDYLTLTGVVQSKFTPVYYSSSIQELFDRQLSTVMVQTLEKGLAVQMGAPQTEIPDLGDGADLGIGLRASGSLAGYDVDVHYQHGYAAIPTIKDLRSVPKEGKIYADPIFGYLPLDKLGISWAGPLGDAGLWGEIAYNKPEQDFYSSSVLNLADYVPESLRPSQEEYLTGILGLDYFFANGMYANVQYVHGLPQEFTKPMVKDYLTMDVYQTFKSDMLKIEGEVIYCLDDDSFSVIPQVSYKLNDNMTVSVKAIRFFGDESSADTFGSMKPLSEVRLGVTLAI